MPPLKRKKKPSSRSSKIAGRHTGDGSVDDGAILELDGHRLVVQLHQEPTKAQSPTKSAPIRARLHQTDQRSEANRGKREPTEDAGLPDKLHLGGAWWGTTGRR